MLHFRQDFVQPIIIVKINPSGGSGSKLFLSTSYVEKDSSTGISYKQIIKNSPTIQRSIDLYNWASNTSSVNVECINEYAPSVFLSHRLLDASKDFINRDVFIYKLLTSGTQTLLFTGRLMGISATRETCSLKIHSRRQWDDLIIPKTRTTNSKILIPVSYGDFDPPTASTWGTDGDGTQFLDSSEVLDVRPVPIVPSLGEASFTGSHPTEGANASSSSHPKLFAVTGDSATAESKLYHYDENTDSMQRLYDSTETSFAKDGGFMTSAYAYRKRTYRIRPSSDTAELTEGSYGTPVNFSNPANAYDGSSTSYASANMSVSGASGIGQELVHRFNLPNPSQTAIKTRLYVKWTCAVASVGTGGGYKVFCCVNGGELKEMNTAVGGFDNASKTDIEFYQDYNDAPSVNQVTIKAWVSNTISIQFRILDIQIMYFRGAGESLSNTEHVREIFKFPKLLYVGQNGFPRSYTGGSGIVDTIPEAHRDLLKRFCNIDASSVEGWSTLNSAQGWKIRWWANDPISVDAVLKKMQFEGQFIYSTKPDGSGKYIFKKLQTSDPYVSADIDHTLTDSDVDNFSLQHTPYTDIYHKWVLNYGKNPATGNYTKTKEDTYSPATTSYGIPANEQIKTIQFDMLYNQTNVETDWLDRAKLNRGIVEEIVTYDILNPTFWTIDVGDIVQLNTSDNNYVCPDNVPSGSIERVFMVIATTHTIEKMTIKLLKVSH